MALFGFLRKNTSAKNQTQSTDKANSNDLHYDISGTQRDYVELDNYDIALKLWLPEPIDIVMSEICTNTHTTKSDLIRQTLFIYLYGRYDLIGLLERGDTQFALNSPIMFSRTSVASNKEDTKGPTNRTPELGKNTEDIKVWIASKMKSDLQTLADKAALPLSHFIREILISNLLGHSYLPARLASESLKVELENRYIG